MLFRGTNKPDRRATVLVETAVVVAVFVMLLFGIVEYCRLVFVQQVMINAAREGARYAVVNTQHPTVVADSKARATAAIGPSQQLTDLTIGVYRADINGVNTGVPSDAQFGEFIVVKVEGDYHPLLPTLLMMDNTIHLSATSSMCCEAN